MDYPAPRVTLVDGAPDLSDAYGVGIGRWDRFAVDWLYGAETDADGRAADGGARSPKGCAMSATATPARPPPPIRSGSLWDDGAEPVAELAPDDAGARRRGRPLRPGRALSRRAGRQSAAQVRADLAAPPLPGRGRGQADRRRRLRLCAERRRPRARRAGRRSTASAARSTP